MSAFPLLTAFDPPIKLIPEEFRQSLFPATHLLEEWREYYVTIPVADQLRINSGEPLTPVVCHADGNSFRLRIENNLGLTCLQALAGGKLVGEPFWVEVISFKFPTPQVHLDFCQALIGELFEKAAHLPFSFSDRTQRGVAEALRPPTPIFTYHFLIHSLARLESAIEIVLAQPYRVLHDRAELVLLHEASQVDGEVILSILQTPENWTPSPGFSFSPAMQVDGTRYAPRTVWQRLPDETFNNPENRFVLHFLRQLLTAIELLPAESWWRHVQGLDEARSLQELATLLRQAVSHPMFDEVSDLHSIPFNSQVLMRREGYRDLMQLWQQFHAARSPLFDRWQQAIDLRAIYQLYELWTFFALIAEIEQFTPLTQLHIGWTDENGVEHESRADFRDGRLLYNQTFRPGWSRRSYSMELRPDFVWIGFGRQVVLDAKFSIQISEYELGSGIDGEAQVVREEHPVRETLYKMHTYRDALVGTQAAVVLYPGNKTVFMPVQGKRVYDFALQEVLTGKYERLQDKIQLDGIGAICLKPGREK